MTPYSEMLRALEKDDKPSEYFNIIKYESGFSELYPELAALINVPQNPKYHAEGDVWTHTMLVVDAAVKYRELSSLPPAFMLSALCHDFGKPLATEKIKGVIHSYGHEIKGLAATETFLRRLGVSDEIRLYVLNMCRLHMKPNTIAASRSSLKASNRMFDEALCPEELIYLAASDAEGQRPQGPFKENTEFLNKRLIEYREIMARPYVQEEDLRENGLNSPAQLESGLEYAHKLRLSGVDKNSALKQTLGYVRKL